MRFNRAQRASYARREEERERARMRQEKSQQEAAKWSRAEGPLPENVWKDGKAVAHFGFSERDSCNTNHVLQLGNGFYLQSAGSVGGWLFFVAIEACDCGCRP